MLAALFHADIVSYSRIDVFMEVSHSQADLKGDQVEVKVLYLSHKLSRKATCFDFGNDFFRSRHGLDEDPG